jgi:hypothetical protein
VLECDFWISLCILMYGVLVTHAIDRCSGQEQERLFSGIS